MAAYVNEALIGRGGFCEVWHCRRSTDGSTFAKKTLVVVDSDSVDRFRREVRILRELDHPNIVRVLGARLSRPPYYYVMPLYRRSLAQEIPTLAGDEPRIRRIFEQVLDAMQHAHAQGVLHRDLKPLNVLMNSDDDVVVSDFGLGRDVLSDSTRHTQTGDTLGTLPYMAPEQQVDAKRADGRSDIYSLGRMLCELYVGSITSAAHDPSQLPLHVRAIVDRCVHPDPSRRFQSVSELKLAWRGLFDAIEDADRQGALDDLVSQLTMAEETSASQAAELLHLLKHTDDDSLQQAFMHLGPRSFTAMLQVDRGILLDVVDKFMSQTESQSWPFEYTDRIADQVERIFIAVPDPEVRSKLVKCVIEVGVGHNRWHVMEVAASLLRRTPPADQPTMSGALLELGESTRRTMRSYVVAANVPWALARYFPAD